MINITVWGSRNVEIEGTLFEIKTEEDMAKFIEYILDKAYYSGEKLCLESAGIDVIKGLANYKEIKRW